jgi:hypothetical protein
LRFSAPRSTAPFVDWKLVYALVSALQVHRNRVCIAYWSGLVFGVLLATWTEDAAAQDFQEDQA